jgi:hypothetical protein
MNLTKVTIADFVDALKCGIESFEKAGRVLVQLIDADPNVVEKILDANPEINGDILETFERIGRKQLYYRLTINESPGVVALRRCPYSEQVKHAHEPIELVIMRGPKTETLLVSVHAMSPDQARQAIGPKRVRTLGEQRAWLEAQSRKPLPLKLSEPYTVRGGKVTIHAPCVLNLADLLRLAQEASGS